MRVDDALQVLGLSSMATPAEIKAAYRRLVKAWHPDRHADDERSRARAQESLKLIIEAYRCLRHGVPPLDASRRPPRAAAGRASIFSVRVTPPLTGLGNRRGPQGAASSSRGTSRPVAARMAFIVALGAFLDVSTTWFQGARPESPEELGPERVAAKATRVGWNWHLQNSTQERWSDCRALVGLKSVAVPTLDPGATLSLSAEEFGPPLSELDDAKELQLFCWWK
jgi:hypothetical protein